MENIKNYEIKRATEKDVPLAIAFRKKLFNEMGVPDEAFIDGLDEKLNELYTDAYRKDEIIHFIAYDGTQPVAVAGALIKNDFPYLLFKPGNYGWIIDVYTDPFHRRRQLAAKLVERTHEWLIEKGVQEAKLISAGAEARRLYERLGYRATWEMSYNLTKKPTYNEFIDIRPTE